MRKRLMSVCIVAILVCGIYGCARTAGDSFAPEKEDVGQADEKIDEADYDDKGETQDKADKKQDMPEIEIISPYSINVCIQSKDEYDAFIDHLVQYTDYTVLWLDLSGTNITVCLDDVLARDNFEYLHISNGGIISVRDMDSFDCTLSGIELQYVSVIKEGVLSHIAFDHSYDQDEILIDLNDHYVGKPPTAEVLSDVDCTNIKLVWHGRAKGAGLLEGQENMDNLKEWDYLRSMQEMEEQNTDFRWGRCLKGLYRYHDDDYSYTSYEFYQNYYYADTGQNKGFICIKDLKSGGGDYFDIIDIPHVRDLYMMKRTENRRFCTTDDYNFDGYTDLIFTIRNMDDGYSCITFLWNEKEQRFEYNASAPEYISYVDAERERLIWVAGMGGGYFIYQFNGNVFTEKHLRVIYTNEVGSHVVAYYKEDGEFIAQLTTDEYNPYLYYYEKIDGEIEEIDAGNLTKAVRTCFPEFDFYPSPLDTRGKSRVKK